MGEVCSEELYNITIHGQPEDRNHLLFILLLTIKLMLFRGPEIGSDHFLVIPEVRLLTKWKKLKQKHSNNEGVYKVYLL